MLARIKGGSPMLRILLLLVLVILAPLHVQAQTFKINDTAVEGIINCDFKVSEISMSEGDINEGPIMSYITTAVTGEIILDRRNGTLDNSLESGSTFLMVCPNKKFRDCRVLRREIKKTGAGQLVRYIFRTFSFEG